MQTFTFRRAFLCGGVAVVVCLASTLSASANLVLNPGFETTNAIWGAFNGAVLNSTAHPHTGFLSIRLPPGNGSNSPAPGAFQTITNLTAGTQFDLTAFGFVTNVLTKGYAGIQATFFSSGGVNLGTVETSPGAALFSNHIDSNSVLNTWIPLDTGVFTAPSGTAYMQVFPIAVLTVGSSVWIDDFDLEIVPEPSTFMLGGFGLIALLMTARRRRQA